MKSLPELIQNFPDRTILVVGDFMLDEYVYGSVDRISQEAPVPVVLEQRIAHVPGGAGNVVRNLRALGARVLLAGVIGSDEAGRDLIDSFEQSGQDRSDIGLFSLAGRPTTRKTRIIAARQQVCRLDREDRSPLPMDLKNRITDFITRRAEEVDAIIISDYDKGVVTPELIDFLVNLCQRHKIYVAVDPQVTHFHYYKNVDVLTPNHHEAGRFLGRALLTDEEVERGGREIIARLGARQLLITRGDRGMTFFNGSDDSSRHFPTMAREVFDVTGAGDTVISVFTLAVSAGASFEDAILLSNRAAGLVVAHVGATTVSPEELRVAVESG